ncbi:MAG TPA: DUF2911 domain-containing protein [Bacteroidia bacterium]|nr:DUF2911 domain-containing protein [Bacteroidia bacterium]
MNKKFFVLAMALLAMVSVNAQVKTPAASTTQTLKQGFALGEVTIEYSRPSAKGRVIYGELVPYGKVWRTGANAATKITITEKLKFEGEEVAAGTYAVYTIPNKDSWEVMLYKDLTLGGNVANYNTKDEVIRVKVKPETTKEKTETFTINLNDIRNDSATLEFVWENTRVPVQVTADIDSNIMASIDKAMNVDSRPYYTAASYYYNNGKDLSKALDWVNKAVEQNPKAFWVTMLKARIELKMGKKTEAVATAENTKKLAQEAKNDDYVKMADALIKEANGTKN